MKNYWEVLKAFEEGKTLRCDEKNWYKGQQSLSSFADELLFHSRVEDWQIVKSDYERALEMVSDFKFNSSLILSLSEVDEVAKLMVKFKNVFR